MNSLPRELQYKIARALDVDSRRALGIYTKLKVPSFLAANIERDRVKPMLASAKSSKGRLMVLQFPFCDEDMKEFYLTMMENDMEAIEDQVMKMVMYKVASWFSQYKFEAPGIVVRAGVPDGSDHFHMSVYKLKEGVDYIEYGIQMEGYAHTASYDTYMEFL